MVMPVQLYDYFRSSGAYRVRIALNLKGLAYEQVSVSLLKGEHRQADYLTVNPQGTVPALRLADGTVLTQSLAICEYLEETHPEPRLLPADASQRARVRALANAVACDIHPLNNLRVQLYLKEEFGITDGQRDAWYAHWIHEGFRSAELTAKAHAGSGPFVFGESVTLAETCLIPQIYNARRFNVPLDDYPTLVAIDANCNSLEAFADARPENQPDRP